MYIYICIWCVLAWAHCCTNRVMLRWNGPNREAELIKSSRLPRASASYSVSARGIRDIPKPKENKSKQGPPQGQAQGPPKKSRVGE